MVLPLMKFTVPPKPCVSNKFSSNVLPENVTPLKSKVRFASWPAAVNLNVSVGDPQFESVPVASAIIELAKTFSTVSPFELPHFAIADEIVGP